MTTAQKRQLSNIAEAFQEVGDNPESTFDLCTLWPAVRKALVALHQTAPFPMNLIVQGVIGYGDQECPGH